ncbi:MAG: sterol desaturase family protein [Salinivenus sp.]
MAALLDALKQTQTVAMLVGLAALMLWEHAHPFFDYFRQSPKERGMHALRNLLLGGLNAGVVSLVFVGLWGVAAIWAEQQGLGLLHWLGAAGGLPLWAHGLGAVLLLDAWMYVWHRINHVIPFLWRFHRVHHHDPKMDVTTASRFHTGEIIISSLLRIGVILLAGVYLWELVLYETVMFAVVQFHHANIALPAWLDRALRAVIVTPNMHKVHHSRFQPETDSNYSSLFSFWDRLGRTFRLRDDPSTLDFGLDGWDAEEDQRIVGLLWAPLKDLDPDDAGEELRSEVASVEVPPIDKGAGESG